MGNQFNEGGLKKGDNVRAINDISLNGQVRKKISRGFTGEIFSVRVPNGSHLKSNQDGRVINILPDGTPLVIPI